MTSTSAPPRGTRTSSPTRTPIRTLCNEGANNIVPGSVKSVITEGDVTVECRRHEVLATLDGNIVDGDITDGDITDGDVSYGDVTSGAVTSSGAITVFVNGVEIKVPAV